MKNYFISSFVEKGKMDAERNEMRLYHTMYYKNFYLLYISSKPVILKHEYALSITGIAC